MINKDRCKEGFLSGLELGSINNKTNVNKENEILINKFTKDIRNVYPYSLKVKHIIELTGYGQATVYRMLDCGEIPGAKKIRGWRVPRDVFLSWWLSDGVEREEIQ